MQRREVNKTIEISGRRWQIGRFDALTGSYIAFKLLTETLPALPMPPELQEKLGMMFSPTQKSGSIMSKTDFIALQRDCLSVCGEIKNVGGVETPIPVLMPDGRWAVDDLENDTVTVIALTLTALVFNISSFFEEDALKALKDTFSTFTLFDAST